MHPDTDTASPAWLWHGQPVDVIVEGLAEKWALGHRAAALWLAKQPGMSITLVVAWTRVMKEVAAVAADRDKPTADEIRDVVRYAQRKGW